MQAAWPPEQRHSLAGGGGEGGGLSWAAADTQLLEALLITHCGGPLRGVQNSLWGPTCRCHQAQRAGDPEPAVMGRHEGSDHRGAHVAASQRPIWLPELVCVWGCWRGRTCPMAAGNHGAPAQERAQCAWTCCGRAVSPVVDMPSCPAAVRPSSLSLFPHACAGLGSKPAHGPADRLQGAWALQECHCAQARPRARRAHCSTSCLFIDCKSLAVRAGVVAARCGRVKREFLWSNLLLSACI